MQIIPTYWAQIFIGCKNTDTGQTHSLETVRQVCSDYVNAVGLCVTLTETEYIYSDSSQENKYAGEPGVIIGLINYPRFPDSEENIRAKALKLAEKLKECLEQKRVSVMFPDETIMLGE